MTATLQQISQRAQQQLQENGVGGITPDILRALFVDLCTAILAYGGSGGGGGGGLLPPDLTDAVQAAQDAAAAAQATASTAQQAATGAGSVAATAKSEADQALASLLAPEGAIIGRAQGLGAGPSHALSAAMARLAINAPSRNDLQNAIRYLTDNISLFGFQMDGFLNGAPGLLKFPEFPGLSEGLTLQMGTGIGKQQPVTFRKPFQNFVLGPFGSIRASDTGIGYQWTPDQVTQYGFTAYPRFQNMSSTPTTWQECNDKPWSWWAAGY